MWQVFTIISLACFIASANTSEQYNYNKEEKELKRYRKLSIIFFICGCIAIFIAGLFY